MPKKITAAEFDRLADQGNGDLLEPYTDWSKARRAGKDTFAAMPAAEYDRRAATGEDVSRYTPMVTTKRGRIIRYAPRRGGARDGAGRPRTGRTGRQIRLSAEAWHAIDAKANALGIKVNDVIEKQFVGGRSR